MTLNFLTPSGVIMPLEVEDNSNVYRSVSDGNRFNFTIERETPVTLPLGSSVKVEGYTYTLFYPLECVKENTEHYVYSGVMHGWEEALKLVKIKDVGNPKPTLSFVLTGKPVDFVRFVAKSMGEGWQVGEVVDGVEHTLAFKHDWCWDALKRVAEEYRAEFRVEGKTIHFGKLELNKDNPLPLSYGMGKGFLPGVGVRSDGDTRRIGRLFAEGGTRNINPAEYGATTLQLPKSASYSYEGVTYQTDDTGSFIKGRAYGVSMAEESFDGTEVYPRREGTVSKVETTDKGFVDFFDSSIPEELDFNDYRIPGEKAMVVFLSGMLQGREFEIAQTKEALTGYKHQERRFRLVPTEQDGFTMPGGVYMPAVGDKYAVFGISLPGAYEEEASRELFERGCKYLHELEENRFKFDGQLDPSYTHGRWLEIGGKVVPGSYIRFSDPDIYPQGERIRIVAVQFPVAKPWAAELTLTNATEGGYVGNTLGKLSAESVLRVQERKAMQRAQRQDYRQALEFIGMVEQAVQGLEGFTARIKPSVIETMGILVGSQATQFDFVRAINSLEVAPFAVNYAPNTQRVTISKGVIRHQTIGITNLSGSRNASDYRYWSLPAYTSPALADEGTGYYVYAKVDKSKPTGNYLLSVTPIGMESDTDYYHLLIGTLSGIIDGDRAYNRLYGISMIAPGQMVINTINSSNGRMRIDLATGEIISDSIKFRRPGDTEEVDVVEYIDRQDRENKEMIDAIEVGGRNLLLKSGERHSSNNYRIALYNLSPEAHTLKTGDVVTLVLKCDLGAGKSGFVPYNTGGRVSLSGLTVMRSSIGSDGIAYITGTWRADESYGPQNRSMAVYVMPQSVDVTSTIEWAKLVRGNKTSREWEAAPEDVAAEMQSKIKESEDASKAAWEAYANAQAKLAKEQAIANADGMITAEEQERIDAIAKATKAAKEYAEAQDALLKTQLEAYADGEITKAEQRAIDVAIAKANLAEVRAKAYADGVLTEAEQKAIAEAQKAYDDAVAKAKELTDAIDIGGRNLLLGSSDDVESYITPQTGNNVICKKYDLSTPIQANREYTLSFLFRSSQGVMAANYNFVYSGGAAVNIGKITVTSDGSWRKVKHTFALSSEKSGQLALGFDVRWGGNPRGAAFEIRQMQLEEGNKATAWDVAPEDVDGKITAIRSGLNNANTLIGALETLTNELKSGKLDASKWDDVSGILHAFNEGNTTIAGGLILTKLIALSNRLDQITAYISGYNEGKGAMIKAGVQNFGPNERENTAIYFDGSAHFGGAYFDNDVLSFEGLPTTPGQRNKPYMQIGRDVMSKTIEEVKKTEAVNGKYPPSIPNKNLSITTEGVDEIYKVDVPVANSWTHLTLKFTMRVAAPYPEDLTGATGPTENSHASLTCYFGDIEVATVTSRWEKGGASSLSYIDVGSRQITMARFLYKRQGVYPLRFKLSGVARSTAAISDVSVHHYWSSSDKVALFSEQGFRFFKHMTNYTDLDYRRNGVTEYTLQHRGGMDVDNIKADYIDASGAVLAGAMFDAEGRVIKSFGKYKKRTQANDAGAVYSYTTKKYTVYHSIPHSNYVPIAVSGDGTRNYHPAVYDVRPYHFTVELINDSSGAKIAFNYVAYKGDDK